MRILLTLPPHSFEDRYGKNIAPAAGTLPPLGLLYLAAYLKKDGHDVSVVDGSIVSYEQLMPVVRQKRPDIVGVSALTFLWKKAVSILNTVKEEFPKTFLIIGGPHPTYFPKQCFIDCPALDAVVMGEGEITFSELCRAIDTGKTLADIAGLAFRTKAGEIRINRPREPIRDLDELPLPARELVDLSKYRPAIQQYKTTPVTNVMGARGCPFRCIFCMHVTGDGIRYRSPQNIINEIKYLIRRYGIKEISFWDDTLTVDKKRVFEMCRIIKQEKLSIIWSAQARVNTLDPEILKEMKSAGCWKIFVGVESLSQKNLDVLKKGITTKEIFDSIRWMKEAGIEIEASFIFGIPGETYEDAKNDVREILKLGLDYMKCFPLTPLPGTEFYENIKLYGTMLTNNFDEFTENKVVFVPHTMTEDQVRDIINYAYKKFYLRPSYVLKRLRKIRSFEEFLKHIRGARAVMKLWFNY
jgi:anaerobic magnesium-protoporphyrin IX monomethyl ester cyclase